jgi:hypothetical protein
MKVPHVNLETGKIYGAEKGSYKYYHEEGHIIFNKEYSAFLLMNDYVFYLWVFFITLAFFNVGFSYGALLCIGHLFIMFLYEEYWCNQYAKQKLNEQKKLNG